MGLTLEEVRTATLGQIDSLTADLGALVDISFELRASEPGVSPDENTYLSLCLAKKGSRVYVLGDGTAVNLPEKSGIEIPHFEEFGRLEKLSLSAVDRNDVLCFSDLCGVRRDALVGAVNYLLGIIRRYEQRQIFFQTDSGIVINNPVRLSIEGLSVLKKFDYAGFKRIPDSYLTGYSPLFIQL